MNPSHHSIELDVLPEDIDHLGHVNNTVYLKWVQAAATDHWLSAAPEEDQRCLLWVVVRHEIDYRRPAMLKDRILASTWVGQASRLSFERFTEIRRESDGKLLAKARTLWCPVSRQTGVPTEVSEAVRAVFSKGENQQNR